MIKVHFLGPIGLDSMEIDAKNVSELKEKLNKIESLKKWLPLCALAVNDKIINDANLNFSDDDNVALLPPVCGG